MILMSLHSSLVKPNPSMLTVVPPRTEPIIGLIEVTLKLYVTGLTPLTSAKPFPGMVILGLHSACVFGGKVQTMSMSVQETMGHSLPQRVTEPIVVPKAVPLIVRLLPPLGDGLIVGIKLDTVGVLDES